MTTICREGSTSGAATHACSSEPMKIIGLAALLPSKFGGLMKVQAGGEAGAMTGGDVGCMAISRVGFGCRFARFEGEADEGSESDGA